MALITKIDELKQYTSGANLGIKMATWLPACTYIEETKLRPELGKQLYDALLAAYNASIAQSPTPLSDEYEALLTEVRKALAPLALAHYTTTVMAQTSDAGQVEKALGDGAPVRMWVHNLQTDTLQNAGEQQIENLLEFLETNAADYPEWTNSSAYTRYKQFLMNRVELFNDEVEINSSRRLFRALRPAIKLAEQQCIEKEIGTDMYQRLFAANLTADEQKLLTMVYPVIANMAMAHAPFPLTFGANGAYTVATSADTNANITTAADAAVMQQQRDKFYNIGRQYLDALITYLNKNADATLFAEYYNSDLYVNPTAASAQPLNNTSSKIFIA